VDGVSNFTYTSANNTFTIATPAGSSYTASISAVEDMIVNGNTVLGSGATDVVQFNATVNSHIIPAANVTYDLGSTTNRFRDLYLSGTSIYLGGHTISANATHIDIGSVTGDADLGELTVSGNAAVTGTVSAANLYSSANATVIGTLTTTDAVISGNLTVSGTTTYVNTSTLNIGDNIITLNADETGTPSQNAGFEVERGTSTNVSFVWDETNDRFTIGSENLQLNDNGKLVLGTGSDFQLYFNGSDAVISSETTNDMYIQANNIYLRSSVPGAENGIVITGDGAVTAYHDNSPKLATTSTGIDVTGTVTADGITSSQDITISENIPQLVLEDTDLTDVKGTIVQANTNLVLRSRGGTSSYGGLQFMRNNGSDTKSLEVQPDGDIIFYDDQGSSQSFFWDADQQRLGLGTTSPQGDLDVRNGTNQTLIIGNTGSYAGGEYGRLLFKEASTELSYVQWNGTGNEFRVWNKIAGLLTLGTSNVERMRIDSLGIATITSQLSNTDNFALILKRYNGDSSAGARQHGIGFWDQQNPTYVGAVMGYRDAPSGNYNGGLRFYVNNTGGSNATAFSDLSLAMTLTSGGNVGIGTSSPSQKLHVNGVTRTDAVTINNGGYVTAGTSAGTISMYAGGTYPGGIVKSYGGQAGGHLEFKTLDTTATGEGPVRMKINGASGNVDIGRPGEDSAMLQVENTTTGKDADVKIFKASGDNSDIAALYVGYDENACLKIYRPRADGNIYIDHTQNDNLRFQFGGASRYILNNTGFYPDDNDARDLGTSSQRWANVYTNDLHLSNMTKENGNDVDGTNGDWTIQEGQEDLFLINNVTGKKYKINMTEVG
jgi:hypothetical protein